MPAPSAALRWAQQCIGPHFLRCSRTLFKLTLGSTLLVWARVVAPRTLYFEMFAKFNCNRPELQRSLCSSSHSLDNSNPTVRMLERFRESGPTWESAGERLGDRVPANLAARPEDGFSGYWASLSGNKTT